MTADRFVVGVPLGRWQTNCYLVGDREAGICTVVDPGEGAAERVRGLLDDLDVRCEAVLLTHGHLDHMWAAPELARDLEVPVFLHPEDRWLWQDPGAGFGDMIPGGLEEAVGLRWEPPEEALEDLTDGQRLSFGGVSFTVRHTPGHTPGHCIFLAGDLAGARVDFALGAHDAAPVEGTLLSGDLLFRGAVGRTDLPRGSSQELLASLARTVLSLEDGTLVLPGHGPDTTVGVQRESNPFLRQVREVAG